MACRSRCANHRPSPLSVLCPLRFFTSCGFARYTATASSNTLHGFPVRAGALHHHVGDFLLLQPIPQRFEFRSDRTELPDLDLGSPFNGPTMMHTAKNFLPTSIPAHRS